jgi:DNA-binding CsgD family transcriptional regulator
MERGTLSPREMEVLTWAAKGKTCSETGQILGISHGSIHSHMNSLKAKMIAANVAHAVALGYELGLIDLRTAEPRVLMAVTLNGQRPHASVLSAIGGLVVSENV